MIKTQKLQQTFKEWQKLHLNKNNRAIFKPDTRFVTDTALKHLSKLPEWNDVFFLDLSNCNQLTDKGLKYIPKNIIHLNVSRTNITNKGLFALPWTLEVLTTDGCQNVTEKGLTKMPTHAGRTKARPFFLSTAPKGFGWRLTQGNQTHYLVGICHETWSSAIQCRAIQKATKNAQVLYSEQGAPPWAPSVVDDVQDQGWDVLMDYEIQLLAQHVNLPLKALDQCNAVQKLLTPQFVKQAIQIQQRHWYAINKAWHLGDDTAALKLEQKLNKTALCRFRNEEWMKELGPALQQSKKTISIFVGYLHTVGPRGLKNLLEALGWKLQRL